MPRNRSHLSRCHTVSLQQRILPMQVTSWRMAPERALPSFYLHEMGGAEVRAALRSIIGNRMAEEVIPIASSQYLVDLPLVEALEKHPQRTLNPMAAEWHILDQTPFASRLLSLLQHNMSADESTCCTPHTCKACGFVEHRSHHNRMAALLSYLRANTWWQKAGVPFVLLSTGISLNIDLTDKVLKVLRARNSKVGPVIIGGVDRSGMHAGDSANNPLLKRMVILPHVASPECAGATCTRAHVRMHCAGCE